MVIFQITKLRPRKGTGRFYTHYSSAIRAGAGSHTASRWHMVENFASQWFSTGIPGVLASPGLVMQAPPLIRPPMEPPAFSVTQVGLFPFLGLSFFIRKMTIVSFP